MIFYTFESIRTQHVHTQQYESFIHLQNREKRVWECNYNLFLTSHSIISLILDEQDSCDIELIRLHTER